MSVQPGLMQRMLRGRWLYVMLGAVVLLLYARMAGSPVPVAPDAPPHRVPAELWGGKPLDTAGLRAVAAREPSLALALIGLSVFIAILGLGGVGMLLRGILTGRIGALWQFASKRLPRWSFGDLLRITLLTVAIGSLLPFIRLLLLATEFGGWAAHTNLWIAMAMLFLDLFVILAILVFAAGKGLRIRELFGWSAGVPDALRIGFRGYIAVFPWLFLLLYLVVEAAKRFHFQPPMEPIHEMLFQDPHPAVLGITVLLACVIGPLAEELFFRGVVYAAIRQRTSRVIAMLASGLVFSLIHTNLMGFLPIMALGSLLAYLYERTGSLLAPLAVHVLHNTLLMSLALTFRQMMALP